MDSVEQIRTRILSAFPGATLDLVTNSAPAAQHSLRVDRDHLLEIARWLRDEPTLRFDYCSNVTGVDWLDQTVKVKVKRIDPADGTEKEVEETRQVPGYLEVVYHLYSMALKAGPLILRVRTPDRGADLSVPSLTPIWRSCEFQEREVFDLYGVRFEGHPDLRRILMWDGFKDHPMRKDYQEPDDYEYEPTAHDEVAKRAAAHRPIPESA